LFKKHNDRRLLVMKMKEGTTGEIWNNRKLLYRNCFRQCWKSLQSSITSKYM